MKTMNIIFIVFGVLLIAGLLVVWYLNRLYGGPDPDSLNTSNETYQGETKDMVVAGGCFWCVEADMQKAAGVIEVISGYSGGNNENPTYDNYSSGGHREVARVVYNPEQTDYRQLLQYFLKHIDPTDGEGSFGDRGVQYSPAIYYETDEERQIAEETLATLEQSNVFDEPLQVPVLERQKFWEAEEYHQDYAKKNPLRYKYYRSASGRDSFINKHWGDNPGVFKSANGTSDWRNFTMPGDDQLREMLSPIQYQVTQEDATETPFQNEYWDNKEEGIYVDVVSGEPLFSSKNKYVSGTGWPSFTKPLEPENIELKDDWSLLVKRTEVVSKRADSHLGHVFNDGPTTMEESGGAEPTGLRYCLNSAALRFIPVDELEEEGYGEYVSHFE